MPLRVIQVCKYIAILNKNGIKVTQAILFGSYAKDSAHKDSDIDIVIESTKKDFFLRDDLREYYKSIKQPINS